MYHLFYSKVTYNVISNMFGIQGFNGLFQHLGVLDVTNTVVEICFELLQFGFDIMHLK